MQYEIEWARALTMSVAQTCEARQRNWQKNYYFTTGISCGKSTLFFQSEICSGISIFFRLEYFYKHFVIKKFDCTSWNSTHDYRCIQEERKICDNKFLREKGRAQKKGQTMEKKMSDANLFKRRVKWITLECGVHILNRINYLYQHMYISTYVKTQKIIVTYEECSRR